VFNMVKLCVSEELTAEEQQIFDQWEFVGNDLQWLLGLGTSESLLLLFWVVIMDFLSRVIFCLKQFHSRLILMPALQLRKLPLRKLPPTDYNHKYGW
jgi:hypothetical protein